jgi:hypothetical protein
LSRDASPLVKGYTFLACIHPQMKKIKEKGDDKYEERE